MAKEGVGNSRNPIRLLLYVPVPWVYILAYLAGVGMEFAFPLNLHKERLLGVGVAGAALFVAGAVIAGWGWAIFYKARTTTVPGRASSKLVTWGPYRFTRNPMYVGLAIAYLGEAGILKQVWPVVFLPLTLAYINFIVLPIEETKLKEVFPAEYQSYRQRVRRWL